MSLSRLARYNMREKERNEQNSAARTILFVSYRKVVIYIGTLYMHVMTITMVWCRGGPSTRVYGRNKSTSVMVRQCNSSHRRYWRGDQRTRRDLSCGPRGRTFKIYSIQYTYSHILYDNMYLSALVFILHSFSSQRRSRRRG